MLKTREKPSTESQMGHLYHSSRNIVRARGWGGAEQSSVFWTGQTSALMNSEPLWMPTQDLHKTKPGNIPPLTEVLLTGDGLWGRLSQFLRLTILLWMAPHP